MTEAQIKTAAESLVEVLSLARRAQIRCHPSNANLAMRLAEQCGKSLGKKITVHTDEFIEPECIIAMDADAIERQEWLRLSTANEWD